MNPGRFGLGPLGRRMLLAFVLVAVSSVALLTAAALVGVGRGMEVSQKADRQQATEAASNAAGAAYERIDGWAGADLSRAGAIAEAAGARLFVVDAAGASVGGGSGAPGGQGKGGLGPAGGAGVFEAAVTANGVVVGAVRLVYLTAAGTGARDVAWSWIAVAAVVALLVAVLASWAVTRRLTRPIAAMTSAARAFTAGDRSARAGVTGPGEIGELAHAFDSMAETVARSEQERRNVTADVAHELRTPLAALQAGLEELRDGLVEPSPHGLAGLHDQSLRLGRVVSDLAELSAAEASRVSVARAEVDLSRVARDELAVREPQLRAAGLVVDGRFDEPVPVRADSDRLHQAVGNLLANAARYCRPGDRVTVVVRSEGDQAVVEVVDSGPGIAADELPHVFDRLWRGRAARQVAGSGIGLAVAREIVMAHGGAIEAASREGAGTTITIRLPRSPASPREP
ncbi:MAG TPA: HAMP domain-containing sensor histidine kinase [Cellulomonas sp.]|uniref:HAMP domain-containing sensor histidine kinase n=1 Tax=Cellulomonas sp. TaxID=40001 RepID=UPI002E310CC1|nr:HAMP domain-containing sensor histidine kinase [Cellulomonas sp.]HEX5333119.1 HAMP domain-containing sensor histidine kinase [Cellulomonas sp.]